MIKDILLLDKKQNELDGNSGKHALEMICNESGNDTDKAWKRHGKSKRNDTYTKFMKLNRHSLFATFLKKWHRVSLCSFFF
ncbi:hypothetical protein DES36_11956 [Alkalibaculum bacchi]|uniref:Uncharacterized protein n=1 Tax=Alkalibaculum bacchi TaxID=645887 RepID=A0A366HYW2_9FIRM|nr:hypothetical protein [Alkalibaculum bacchi]RBP59331.1 hypothetical protein DES36_11956 [Alkalibaculum bacchi]